MHVLSHLCLACKLHLGYKRRLGTGGSQVTLKEQVSLMPSLRQGEVDRPLLPVTKTGFVKPSGHRTELQEGWDDLSDQGE